MNTEDNVFHVTDDNGKQIRMEVLFTYDDTEQGLVYIVYTDNTLDDEGNVKHTHHIFILMKTSLA